MDNILNITIPVSMVVLTVVMYTLATIEILKAAALAGWTAERRAGLRNKLIATFVGWGIFTAVLSLTGFLSDFSGFPPRMMIVLIIPLVTMIVVTFSKTARELLPFVPVNTLLKFQFFRFFVELVLWMAFLQHILPVQMTFEGRNFDIVVGITGPIMAALFSSRRTVVMAWNISSLGILLNIVVIALLSMPTPFRAFPEDPSSAAVATFPLVWLPAFLVPMAYGLHFFSIRQLSIVRRVGQERSVVGS